MILKPARQLSAGALVHPVHFSSPDVVNKSSTFSRIEGVLVYHLRLSCIHFLDRFSVGVLLPRNSLG